eukprot:jgi/Mesvir1/13487/Mv16536-RA.1
MICLASIISPRAIGSIRVASSLPLTHCIQRLTTEFPRKHVFMSAFTSRRGIIRPPFSERVQLLHTVGKSQSVKPPTASLSYDELGVETVETILAETGEETSTNSPPRPKKGAQVELVCLSLAFKGMGVCKVGNYVVLCEGALPGERLIARITKRQSSHAEAVKIATLEPHANKVEPPCPHFTSCGGCKLQNLAYESQLAAKESQVRELIGRLGKFPDVASLMKPIVPCAQPYRYRNKMEFSFSTRVWTAEAPAKNRDAPRPPEVAGYALGLHAPGRFDKVLPISSCHLQHEVADRVLALVDAYARSHQEELPAYDNVAHKGFLRSLMVRKGSNADTGAPEFMINFVTSDTEDAPHRLAPLSSLLVQHLGDCIASVVVNVTSTKGGSTLGERQYVLHGRPYITEQLRGLRFEISANSFFQTNTGQAEVLYALVEEACGLRSDGSEVLLDLFCGTGTIGLSMARKLRRLVGYEIVEAAVADARSNAARNGISNAEFRVADLMKVAQEIGRDVPRPDVICTDPNRPGMGKKLLSFLATSGCPRIVYVSCNPATQARDLDILCHGPEGDEEGSVGDRVGPYELVSIQPVDMFPHTPHVESIAVLQRRETR